MQVYILYILLNGDANEIKWEEGLPYSTKNKGRSTILVSLTVIIYHNPEKFIKLPPHNKT